MSRKNAQIGDKSGKLTILEILGKYKPNCRDYYCLVKCDCGNEEIIKCTYISTGERTMCEQCKKEEIKNNQIMKIGEKFGKLTIVEYLGQGKNTKDKHFRYKVKCECGEEEVVSSTLLRTKKRMCCKCSRKENTKHNMSRTRLYGIYRSMKQRCYLKTSKAYKYYGGRGIKVCDEWRNDSSKFFEWALANGYKDGLSIDRVDVNGNYEPSNCRWTTAVVQANNQRTNRKLTYNGETHGIYEWERIMGLPHNLIGVRIRECGWSAEKAITTPVLRKKSQKTHLIKTQGIPSSLG